LQLRTPLDDLRDEAPDLVLKLEEISHTLEQASLHDVSENSSDGIQRSLLMERDTVHYWSLNEAWLATLAEVRRLEKFVDFLHPDPVTKLQAAAANGPVVILNASNSGCAALVMTMTNVECVPFPQCTLSNLQTLVKMIHSALGEVHAPPVTKAQMKNLMTQMRDSSNISHREDRYSVRVSEFVMSTDEIFRVLWKSVIKPVICYLGMKV